MTAKKKVVQFRIAGIVTNLVHLDKIRQLHYSFPSVSDLEC